MTPDPTDNRATAERIAREVITIHHPNVQPEPNTGCWLWMGSVSSQGYGRIRGTTRTHMVHRLSFQTAGRVIPPGFVLDHMCRVRSCVNPDHLRAVTVRQNVTENSLSLQAQNKQKSHCPKCGGPYRVRPDGWRACPPCHLANGNRSRTRLKALKRLAEQRGAER